jgi:hypothetical protein
MGSINKIGEIQMNMIEQALHNNWHKGVQLVVRYRGTNLDWVDVPKPTAEGLVGYDTLNWDTKTYDYKIRKSV